MTSRWRTRGGIEAVSAGVLAMSRHLEVREILQTVVGSAHGLHDAVAQKLFSLRLSAQAAAALVDCGRTSTRTPRLVRSGPCARATCCSSPRSPTPCCPARRLAAATVAAAGLTERECEVLAHIADDRSDHEIARALVLSEKTVKTQVLNIPVKLDVADRTQAARCGPYGTG